MAPKDAPLEEMVQRSHSNLDYLQESALLIENLKPDENGWVILDRTQLGGKNRIHVIAVDPGNTVYRTGLISNQIDKGPLKQDLRLESSLGSMEHYTEQNRISIIPGGETFSLDNITTSQFEVYDSLKKVFRLYTALSENTVLSEFSYITRWPVFSPEEKHKKYSKYACHELNFYLYQKDF